MPRNGAQCFELMLPRLGQCDKSIVSDLYLYEQYLLSVSGRNELQYRRCDVFLVLGDRR